jgi:hypothetical protein
MVDETRFEPSTEYFARTLITPTPDGGERHVDERLLIDEAGSKVILGEPGMGKSELIRELSRRLGVEPVTAIRFMKSRSPARLVVSGKPLLIDGLDEAMALRDGDAIDEIAAQLDAVDAPEFILACRSREWQARNAAALHQIYDSEPVVFTLQPLTQGEAGVFLRERFPNVDSTAVLDHLDRHGLGALAQNPLTLGLLGRVANTGEALPESRAALFAQVSNLIWPEHDENRPNADIGRLTSDDALAAAGAMSAAMLFAGAEAVVEHGQAAVREGEIPIAEVECLPGAQASQTMMSSKLFQSVGDSRVAPIHRVVAEFLGARWLAQQCVTPRLQRRLLAVFQGHGPVPASLRGLHAWLAHHAPAMAEQVISGDPYGVLLYGETGALPPTLAQCLFDSLRALAEDDPWFRAGHWSGDSARGLMVPLLRDEIDAVIRSADSNKHFRALLIEALNETELASELSPTLEMIVLCPDRFYEERMAAIEALLPHKSREWWCKTVEMLGVEGPEDGTGLALNIVRTLDLDIDENLLINIVFADLGVLVCKTPRSRARRSRSFRWFSWVGHRVPPHRIVPFLDKVTEYTDLIDKRDWESWNDIAELVATVMVRGIEDGAVGPAQAPSIWRWLATLENASGFDRDEAKKVIAEFETNDALRQAVQEHVLFGASKRATVWDRAFDLQQRNIGLAGRAGDIVHFLEHIDTVGERDATWREQWKDLLRLGTTSDGLLAGVRDAGVAVARGDRELEDFLWGLENPEKPQWQIDEQRREAEEARERENRHAEARRHYLENRDGVRRGELEFIINPAKAYLGRYQDLNNDQSPETTLSDWLGENLRDDVLSGLEAVLVRPDLPTPDEVATGFAEGVFYNYSCPIIAGLSIRVRAGQPLDDLPSDVLTVGLLLAHHFPELFRDGDRDRVQNALGTALLSTQDDRITFARVWIEPQLIADKEHVSGLYMLAHDESWRAAGLALAPEWLRRFPDLLSSVELEIVDCLTHANAFEVLAEVAAERSEGVFSNFDRMLNWLAIDVLVRFEAVRDQAQGIGGDFPAFLWWLRNRFRLRDHERIFVPTVDQAAWIIAEFRGVWPNVSHPVGVWSGDTNPHDATEFLRFMIDQLASNTSGAAIEALRTLAEAPEDSYTETIQHMMFEQRRKKAEEAFDPLPPTALRDLLGDGPPASMSDLVALAVEVFDLVQRKLIGDDLDQVRDFWSDDGVPYPENRCRDRLAAMIEPEFDRYGVLRITESDMPQDKRADLGFLSSRLQLPMEVKGQWHPDVWDAASGQLDSRYLIDWRSEDRGVFCVLWFGDVPSRTGRRLKAHPDGAAAPSSAEDMRAMLIERIPPNRRAHIEVVVLDLTSGRR